jgi:hypothetical protein
MVFRADPGTVAVIFPVPQVVFAWPLFGPRGLYCDDKLMSVQKHAVTKISENLRIVN